MKILSPEENDYLYDNCCVENVESIINEKMEELKSKTSGGYVTWLHY